MSAAPRFRVLVTRALPDEATKLLQRLASEHGLELDWWAASEEPMPHAAICERVRGCHGLLCLLTDRIDRAVLDAAGPQLRVISTLSVGFDHIDVAEASRRGIPICHIGSLDVSTAELATTLTLIVARRIIPALDALREGRVGAWSPLAFCGMGLQERVVGVLGFGNIGLLYARLMRGLGCRIIYSDIAPRPAEAAALQAEFVELSELLRRADIVSVHLPLLDSTRGLINTERLAHMQPHAILINTARGPIVDQEALLQALNSGKLAGAGLDVTVPEPLPKDHPLLHHPKCVVLPHIGSATFETREAMGTRAVDNLLAGLLRTTVSAEGHLPLQINKAVVLRPDADQATAGK